MSTDTAGAPIHTDSGTRSGTGDSDPAIRTDGLTKHFGRTPALDALDLTVPTGSVFGFLGPNGAGKTTAIRLLVGLLRPTSGTAQVLGLDIVHDRRDVHRVIGYLPGDLAIDLELTGRQYLDHLGHLRGGVDPAVRAELVDRFDLDLDRRIGAMSHGNRQKLGIVQACMHQPRVLVLDEPTQGLDPIMQRSFLELLRDIRGRGDTVFLSSHVLSEVEDIADHVAVVRDGRLVASTSIDELKQRARRRIALTFAQDPPIDTLRNTPGVVEATAVDHTVELVVEGSMAELLRAAAPDGIDRVVSDEVDLTDVFLRMYEGR